MGTRRVCVCVCAEYDRLHVCVLGVNCNSGASVCFCECQDGQASTLDNEHAEPRPCVELAPEGYVSQNVLLHLGDCCGVFTVNF